MSVAACACMWLYVRMPVGWAVRDEVMVLLSGSLIKISDELELSRGDVMTTDRQGERECRGDWNCPNVMYC